MSVNFIKILKRKHQHRDEDLASKLNISLKQLLKYKTARNRINGQVLYNIANLYNVPICSLLED